MQQQTPPSPEIPHQQQTPALLDVDQVAWQLGLCQRTIELKQAAGLLPGFVKMFGRHPRWRRDVILQWVAEGCPDCQKAHIGAIGANAVDNTESDSLNSAED